ncbi:glycosyltransferase family 2 protein [Enterococcus pseudoavium]|uniref:Glycosyltransferase family 2 protein n=1 Tax=Enterococcus pseudoavium TaxID=44007 RepID=A0ABU3FFA1_9ENTE|nr:glycosyltransferase family 2 protein [Enterococcus pseudoavium]MDT2769695.1 glycosyltransferase family 2 protein [Enterococcus pseudoavium]
MVAISVIVPVYNVEDLLSKCVDSILIQSFKDFELLLINDGSKDKSGDICEEYAKKDSRISVYHKKNGGLSSARNYGIEHAHGNFITFIDSDDFIDKSMLKILYDNMIENDADLSITGVRDIYDGKISIDVGREKKLLNSEETLELMLMGKKINVYAVSKLYKRSIFENIKYPVGKAYEDSYIIVDILRKCSTIFVDTIPQYNYYHRADSITTLSYSTRDLDYIEAWTLNYDKIKEFFPNLEYLGLRRVCFSYFFVLDKILLANKERETTNTKDIVNFLRENSTFILNNPYFSRNRKIALRLLKINLKLYKPFPYIMNRFVQKSN